MSLLCVRVCVHVCVCASQPLSAIVSVLCVCVRAHAHPVSSLVGFKVTVHDPIVVQVFQCQYSFSKVHACHIHRQSPDVL